jgi:uncharacterized repeat protein (TIGR03803 family)
MRRFGDRVWNSQTTNSGRRSRPAAAAVHCIVRVALAFALLAALGAVATAQTYTVLYSFAGGADGMGPGPIIRDATTGNLYGVTSSGGAGGVCDRGCGTVFELTPAGVESVLHSFIGNADGIEPLDVFRDAKGEMFGTTLLGGPHGGDGTVFRISSKGAEKILHSFKGGTDGAEPTSGLIQDPNTGDFYGVTASGGAYSDGTVYRITSAGSTTILYSFGAKGTLGNGPEGRLVQNGTTGNLYGMLTFGGMGCGVVFELTPAGVETTLHVFGQVSGDGCEPGPGDPGLIMDMQGNLFGTTYYGGNSGNGVVFELTADGTEKVLYKFKGKKKGDGAQPYAGLVLDVSTGNLYGTTELGGAYDSGTIFELSPPIKKNGAWNESVLYTFTGGTDGSLPLAGLILDTQTGNLYGTAAGGGTYGYGVAFRLMP